MRNRGIGAGQIIDRSKLHLYLNKLQHCGINLYIQNEQLILLDEEGHPSLFAPIMIATLSTCAQLERDNISFRLQSGRKRFYIFVAIKIKRSMKKIVFILLIFCSFLVVWGCNKNKTKCVPQKEATSDSSMRSNDDTLSLMIEHEVDDVDYGVIIKRGDKTIHRFGYKYPEDDDLVPNEERIDSCLLTDLNFDGIKEDVLFYLGSFGASGTKHFDAYVWNPNTEHYDKIEEFKDIPNPKISDKYKCILSRVYVSSAENEYAKYVCTNGHLIKVAELRQYWKGNIYPERDRAVYEEHFIKANVWKRNLKLNQISDFWKPVVPF